MKKFFNIPENNISASGKQRVNHPILEIKIAGKGRKTA